MKKLLLLIPVLLALVFSGIAYGDTIAERTYPQYVESGEWFTIEVVFICSENETNSIGIADNLEGVVDVQGDITWCKPKAHAVRVLGTGEFANQIEYIWLDIYEADTEIKAVYKVLIEGEPMQEFSFNGFVAYYVGKVQTFPHPMPEPVIVDLPIDSVKIKPGMDYVLGEVNRWQMGDLTMSEVLVVVNAWIS